MSVTPLRFAHNTLIHIIYNNKEDNMKKTYIAPSVEVIEMEATNMLATSLDLNDDTTVDTNTDGGQLGREDRPSRPNVWEQGW